MSKRFFADVRTARNRVEDLDIDGLVTLDHQRGELITTFINEKLDAPIHVHLVPTNSDAYPDDNNFALHTPASDIVVKAELELLQNYTFGQTVFESLRHVADGLKRALARRIDNDQDGDIAMGDATASADASDGDASDSLDGYVSVEYDSGSDDGQDWATPNQTASKMPAEMARGVLNRIKRDLRKCREIGAKVGIFAGVVDDARTHTISLSIRARKLGISDEALEAWDVDPADYIVLLLHLNEPYPSVEQLLNKAVASMSVDFRFGKCKRYKPSVESVRRAFVADKPKTFSNDIDTDDHPFNKLFLSDSMEQFMNESFLSMFKLRLHGQPTWDAANSELHDLHILGNGNEEQLPMKSNGEGKETATSSSDSSNQQTLPTILTWDCFTESFDQISTPLVALQFALHYFVRCTEYCLRCHRKVDKEFEALKPYVCQNPLCLFQYIALGFGPSIEHEILTQPYVVDLLVTLCYSSTQVGLPNAGVPQPRPQSQGDQSSLYAIRTFPNGLHLKVPPVIEVSAPPAQGLSPFSAQVVFANAQAAVPPAMAAMIPGTAGAQPCMPLQVPLTVPESGKSLPIAVRLDTQNMSFTIEDQSSFEQQKYLKEGSWVVLRHPMDPNNAVHWGNYHAYIDIYDPVRQHGTFKAQDIASLSQSAKVKIGKSHACQMELYLYNIDFDDLDDRGKAESMKLVMDTIPPISQLREWLTLHPHARLKTNPDISPSAVTLLEWIIASNRSLILQVSHVQDHAAQDNDRVRPIKTRDQEIIPGMGNSVVQFRLAMGNPDKELRFHRALKEQKAQPHSPNSHQWPTLFAWHGSALQNWHSILRHGLDYSKIANGRAFGDGVYFSPAFSTSIGYARSHVNWPKSALNPTAMLALCEIINSPSNFVSITPHYVVQQLDWIQCRYLFVQTSTSHKDESKPGLSGALNKIDRFDELLQDPTKRVQGPGGHLQIPRKAVSGDRLQQRQPTEGTRTSPKRALNDKEPGNDTDEEDVHDLECLFSGDEAVAPSLKRFHSLPKPDRTRDSSVDSIAARQMTETRPLTPPKLPIEPSVTDFRPGTLDLKSIPQLALPTWANGTSAKRLAADIKMMQKIQATIPLHELGWYIDFDNIDNMFQWIVELHTFDPALPLAKDMKKCGITSVVIELRFGESYPMSPPFVRVIRPKFLPFMQGGGGHVTIGGAICMELLTNNGWNPTMSIEAVLVSIKAAMSSLDPTPARLQPGNGGQKKGDYNAFEALEAFQRYAGKHGWQVPKDATASATQQYKAQ